MSDVDLYESDLPQPQKAIIKRLRTFIARTYPDMTESLKWHVPTYSLNGRNLIGLQDFKDHVNLNLFRGARLHDSCGLLLGTGKQVRHLTFRAIRDINFRALRELIDETIVTTV